MVLLIDPVQCSMCHRRIEKDHNVVAFPAFVANEWDPLWVFNDSAFHTDCFASHPLARQAQARYEELVARTGPGHRYCERCGCEIDDPDNCFSVGHLTDDASQPLFAFNYTQLHSSCLGGWSGLDTLEQLLRQYARSNLWKGGALDSMLREVEKAKKDSDR